MKLNFGFGALDYLERITGRKCSEIFREMEEAPSISLLCDIYMAGRSDDAELTRKEASRELDAIIAESGFTAITKQLKEAIDESPILNPKKKSGK